jgi:hypothetical protein
VVRENTCTEGTAMEQLKGIPDNPAVSDAELIIYLKFVVITT